MSRSRTGTWIALIVAAVGLVVAAIAGLFVYLNVTATPLHRNADDVTSVTYSTPSPQWAAAAEKGRRIVRASVIQQNLPGISVAVGASGNIVWAEGFGWADLATRVPVSPEVRFRIGHASIALTSAAVGLLREQGRLHLEDEIQEYVPAFPRKPWPVTVRQLMGHVAGIRHYRDTEWGDKPSARCERASEGVRSFANDPLLFEPETQYRYSTYGWVLVSAAVEAAAREPFFQFMRTRIFEPLGMSDTTADRANEPMEDRATSYYQGNLGRELTTTVDYSCFAGAGAFLSTPSDLVRFGLAMTSGKFLKPDTVKLLQTRQQLTSGKDTDYGLGWMLDTVELAGTPTPLVFHASRTIEGASTSFMTFPERGLVVAVSSNISFADMRSVALAIAQAFVEPARNPVRK